MPGVIMAGTRYIKRLDEMWLTVGHALSLPHSVRWYLKARYMGKYHNTAIVFGNLKDALLYFEYVIPMNISGISMGYRPTTAESGPMIERFKETSMEGYRELQASFGELGNIVKLFPPQLASDPRFETTRNMFEGLLFAYMVKTVEGEETFEKYVGQLAKLVQAEGPVDPNQLCPTIEGLQRLFSFIVSEFQLKNVLVDSSHFFMGTPSIDNFGNCLSAQEIRVIDTTKVTLPQIMEFRKDKEAMSRMRNFRLFAYQHYSGKDKAFIEDDIQKRLSDYYETLNACGFETTVKTLSFLFESKFLMGAFATSAVSLLVGNGQLAVEAFGTGAIIELGKLSLEYAKRRNELKKICKENPISYIADARMKLEK